MRDVTTAHAPYRYIQALVAAIESWGGDALGQDRMAFTYRGADLRRAVERCLYFELSHHTGLRTLYLSGAHGHGLAGPYAGLIAPYLCAGTAAGTSQRQDKHARFADRLRRRFSGRMLPSIRSVKMHRTTGQPDFLFLAIEPKFGRYLKPVVAALRGRAAFLTIDDAATEELLASENQPVIAVRSLSRRLQLAPGGALRSFVHLCHYFDVLSEFLCRHAPRAVVVPEGNVPAYELANRAARMASVRSLCIQYGWSPYMHNGFRHLDYDAMLVWGELFAELLAQDNPRQRFVVTGSPVSFPSRGPAERPVGGIGFFLQHLSQLATRSDWDDFLDLIGWTARIFPDLQIIVRTHPSKPALDAAELSRIGSHANVRYMAPATHGLPDALTRCDVVVSPFSTVLLEAIAAGAVPVIVASGLPQFWPDLPAMGAAVEAGTFNEARRSLARLVNDGPWRARLREAGDALRPRLFGAVGAPAVERLAAEIAKAETVRVAS